MAGLQASDAVSGAYLDPPSPDAASQPQSPGVLLDVAGLNLNDAAAVMTPTGTRTYLDVSPVTMLPGGFPVLGADGVYTNGRCKDHGSPRVGSRSRDSSSDRSLSGATTPCGIMKVSSTTFKFVSQ